MGSRFVLPRVVTFAVLASVVLGPEGVCANERSAELRAKGATELFNLDRDEAIASYRAAIAADPNDGDAYRGLASALWISITFRRGTMIVDSYLGRVSRQNVKMPPPPPEIAEEFQRAVTRAVEIGRAQVVATPKNPQARYQLGSAVAVRASYAATVDGSVRSAFGAAREAFNEHEEVMRLDPRRGDAGLIVGTYRYLVAALSMPVRWMAYAAGFGGDAQRGLRLIEAAATYAGDNQTDARMALVLLYNREERYMEALAQLMTLQSQYPKNRLLWLEAGATAMRAGRAQEANRLLTDGLARLATDSRPRMFGEDGLWYLYRGTALTALRRDGEAEADLNRVLASEARQWVHGRARLELGKLAGRTGNRTKAEADLRAAISLLDADGDAPSAAEARRLLKELK